MATNKSINDEELEYEPIKKHSKPRAKKAANTAKIDEKQADMNAYTDMLHAKYACDKRDPWIKECEFVKNVLEYMVMRKQLILCSEKK
jgi:hypothetical protein